MSMLALLPPPFNALDSLGASHLSVGGVALLAGAYLKPQLTAALNAFPHWLVRREKTRYDEAVAAGKISPAVDRLARKLKRTVLEWANEEMPQALGEDKMAKALLAIEKLPYIGALVAADPLDVEAELQTEYNAIRAEVKAEAEATVTKTVVPPDAPVVPVTPPPSGSPTP